MIKNEIIEFQGQRWKIRQAISLTAAENEICLARASGSVGSKSSRFEQKLEESTEHYCNRIFSNEGAIIIADVHRVNSDDTEQQPYTELY